jgi:hypothetical protein
MPSLLSPNVQAIAFPAPSPQRDRAPDGLAAGTPWKLRNDLIALLGTERVLSRPIDLIRFATDASPIAYSDATHETLGGFHANQRCDAGYRDHNN